MRHSPIIPFRTGCPEAPKSDGVIIDLQSTDSSSLSEWSNEEICGIYKLHRNKASESTATAKGKVVLLEQTGSVPKAICYQNNGKTAAPAYCGNAYASIAAYLFKSGRNPTFKIVGKSPEILVEAEVELNETNSSFTVTQSWRLENHFVINDKHGLFGQPTIYVSFLNEYRVVLCRSPRLFDECCMNLTLSFVSLRLTEKICLYCTQTTRVRFFTASYVHGGAPITGLCTLSFIRQKYNWLKGQIAAGVITPQGWESLPQTQIDRETVSLKINANTVHFHFN